MAAFGRAVDATALSAVQGGCGTWLSHRDSDGSPRPRRRRSGASDLPQAMRANLKRRKEQQRQREAAGATDAEPVEEG